MIETPPPRPTPPPCRWVCDVCGELGPVVKGQIPQHTNWMCRLVRWFDPDTL